MKYISLAFAFMMACVFAAAGKTGGVSAASQTPVPAPEDSLTVSVLTCYPGEKVYELYGHTGLRIRSASMDSVWNYGVFDFNQPNFIWRFSLGKTDYMLAAEKFDEFMRPYVSQNREVVEQELNLTQSEARTLLENLRLNALPANRTYRYNYLRDNCATRVFDQLNEAVTDSIPLNDPVCYPSYRKAMKNYHGSSLWYSLGVDMALGSEIDRPLTNKEQIFIPMQLRTSLRRAVLPDGRKLVKATNVLYDEPNEFERSSTPDNLAPMFLFSIVSFVCALLCIYFVWRRKVSKIIYTIFYSLIGLTGLLLCYLVFVSDHPATSPNYLLIWLNPLGLIVPCVIWLRGEKARWIMYPYMLANTVGIMVFLCLWPLFNQYINYSLLSLVISDLLFSVTYVLVRFRDVFPESLLNYDPRRMFPEKERDNK